jgi:hypothetical protein
MNESLSDRLKQQSKKLDLTPRSLRRKLNASGHVCTVRAVQNWFNGISYPRGPALLPLAMALNVNVLWLMAGIGPMEIERSVMGTPEARAIFESTRRSK